MTLEERGGRRSRRWLFHLLRGGVAAAFSRREFASIAACLLAYNNFDRPFSVVFLIFGCHLKLNTEKVRLKSVLGFT
jgi:hypothetical protein